VIGFGPLDKPFDVLVGKSAGEHINAFDLAIKLTRPIRVSKEIELLCKWGHLKQVGVTEYHIVYLPWQNDPNRKAR